MISHPSVCTLKIAYNKIHWRCLKYVKSQILVSCVLCMYIYIYTLCWFPSIPISASIQYWDFRCIWDLRCICFIDRPNFIPSQHWPSINFIDWSSQLCWIQWLLKQYIDSRTGWLSAYSLVYVYICIHINSIVYIVYNDCHIFWSWSILYIINH